MEKESLRVKSLFGQNPLILMAPSGMDVKTSVAFCAFDESLLEAPGEILTFCSKLCVCLCFFTTIMKHIIHLTV